MELGEGVALDAMHIHQGLEVALLFLVAHLRGEEPVDGALLIHLAIDMVGIEVLEEVVAKGLA